MHWIIGRSDPESLFEVFSQRRRLECATPAWQIATTGKPVRQEPREPAAGIYSRGSVLQWFAAKN
jgi:hypothetical protein